MIAHQAAGLTRRRSSTAQPIADRARPKIVGVLSGKGGVGKTTLAVNVAISAARAGQRVLVIDGDAGLANAELLMGLIPRFNLDDWASGVPIEEVLCRGQHGLNLLVAGKESASEKTLAQALAGEGVNSLRDQISTSDLVFVDLGAGISPTVLNLAGVCRTLWLVATPEPTSLADAYTTLKRLLDQDDTLRSRIELVVNRARSFEEGRQTHGSLTRLAERFLGQSLPLRGVVPEDAVLHHSILQQSPAVLGTKASAAVRRLELLAESLS